MSELRVRIGPSVDRAAFDAAFSSISQSAKRAFEKIGTEAAKAGQAETKAAKDTTTQIQRVKSAAARTEEIEAKRMLRTLEQSERTKVQLAQRSARERMNAEREYYRSLEQQQRDAARNQKRLADDMKRQTREAAAAHPRFAVGLGHGTSMSMSGMMGAGMGAMRFGMGVAGDIAHAYGVNTSMGTAMEKNADLDTLATQITNEAHEKGQKYADPEALKQRAFEIGNKTGTGANQIMEGFQEFVGKTGDLNTISGSMEELSKIAKGTGSSLKDVVSAAADVSNQLGDVPNKAEKVNAVLRVMAGEAKLGAVPMRSFGSQTAKIVASSQMFQGDAAKNMGVLTAMAQSTRMRGGSGSPQQAATSVGAFASVFSTKARLKAFRDAGINVDGAGGKLGDINDIIIQSLQKTQKKTRSQSNEALNALYGGKLAGKSVGGYAEVFRSTYASTSGTEQEKLAAATKATREEMDHFTHAAMDAKEVQDSFNRAMKTGQSQAELWNNATQQAAEKMQTALLPALVGLTPKVTAGAEGLSNFVDFLTGKKKDPPGGALSDDMFAIHKALANGGKVDQALVTKALKDSEKFGKESTDADNEARGMKEHAGARRALLGYTNVLQNIGSGDITSPFSFGKIKNAFHSGSARADTNLAESEKKAKDMNDQLSRAFKELTSATLKVHIVSSDVSGKEAPGAAEPSTDSLSPHPSH